MKRIISKGKTPGAALRAPTAGKSKVDTRRLAERDEWQRKVAALSRANAELQSELQRRKLVERTLAEQQRKLARSKNALQLHVQARKRELQALQRRYELILNSAVEGICGIDLQGRVTFANPAAASIMGWSVKEMVGLRDREVFQSFQSDDNAPADHSEVGHPTEVIAARRDGSTFVAEYVRSPIRERGRMVGEVLLFKDVTERRQAEESLTQNAAELARSNAELEQFAFVASHDLQEPLRKIQTFGDRLKAKCDAAGLEDGNDYLERMQKAAVRMQTLINDLLTFSRIVSRTEPFVPVDLNVVTREVLGDLEVRIEKTSAVVEVGELPTIEADPLQMRQLLQNLIGNALKFHAAGGTPRIHIQAQWITDSQEYGYTALLSRKPAAGLDAAAAPQFCQLTVQDNGIGFDEKHLGRIFAIFQRLHGRHEYEGTGIGLAVCRRIMDRHGGVITARSKPGEGATFFVVLPVRQPRQPKATG